MSVLNSQLPRQGSSGKDGLNATICHIGTAAGLVVVVMFTVPLWSATSPAMIEFLVSVNSEYFEWIDYTAKAVAALLTTMLFFIVKLAVQSVIGLIMQRLMFFASFGRRGHDK